MGHYDDQYDEYYRQQWEEEKIEGRKIWTQVLADLNNFKNPSHRVFEAKMNELMDYARARLWEYK